MQIRIAAILMSTLGLVGSAVADDRDLSSIADSTEAKVYATPDVQYQRNLGKVAMIISVHLWGLDFPSSASSKEHGKDFLQGCLAQLPRTLDHPELLPYWPVVPFFCLFGAPVASVVGGVGAGKTPDSNQILESEASVRGAVDTQAITQRLIDRLVSAARDGKVDLIAVPNETIKAVHEANSFRPLESIKADTVIEVLIQHALGDDSHGDKKNPPLQLISGVNIRIVRVSDNIELLSERYLYRGKKYKYIKWASNNAELLVKEIQVAEETIGHDIGDRVFLLYPFPSRKEEGELGICGLNLREPPFPRGWPKPKVENLQPILSWDAFPRESDIAIAPEEMARIENVSYDVIVATGESNEPPDVIYRREKLLATNHKIEIMLKPNTRYFWSVRARFSLDGRQRVTEWGARCPFEQNLVIDSRLYRFYTPSRFYTPRK